MNYEGPAEHDDVTVTERGWAGHFICADRCLFRRNTLVEGNGDRVVISTVGSLRKPDGGAGIDTLGAGGRYFETMAFGASDDGEYVDADVGDQRDFNSPWQICAPRFKDLPAGVENDANQMHDTVVREFVNSMSMK